MTERLVWGHCFYRDVSITIWNRAIMMPASYCLISTTTVIAFPRTSSCRRWWPVSTRKTKRTIGEIIRRFVVTIRLNVFLSDHLSETTRPFVWGLAGVNFLLYLCSRKQSTYRNYLLSVALLSWWLINNARYLLSVALLSWWLTNNARYLLKNSDRSA